LAEYLVHHTHLPEQCHEAFEAWSRPGPHDVIKGREFFCSCPSGEHGGFFTLEAADPEAVLALLPRFHRTTSRVYAGETMVA